MEKFLPFAWQKRGGKRVHLQLETTAADEHVYPQRRPLGCSHSTKASARVSVFAQYAGALQQQLISASINGVDANIDVEVGGGPRRSSAKLRSTHLSDTGGRRAALPLVSSFR